MKQKSTGNIADLVVSEVNKYWAMANIPTIAKWLIKKHVVKLFEQYQALIKNNKRTTDTEIQKREIFLSDLKTLFDIASPDAEKIIRCNKKLSPDAKCEDILFLQDQRGERHGWMTGKDFVYEKTVEKYLLKESKNKAHEASSSNESSEIIPSLEELPESSEPEHAKDEDFCPPKKLIVKEKSATITLEVPRNILGDPEVTAMLDRTKCTNRVAVGVISSVLIASGADLDDFSLSKDTVRVHRNSNRDKIAADVKSDFEDKKPKFGCLHWDGKLLENVMGTKDERLAILISGSPNFVEGKVLGIPSLKDVDGNSVSTGENQYEACIDMIEKWNIRDVIVAMCFDTTSTNTGCHKGTCKRIESDYLGRKIFWMGC